MYKQPNRDRREYHVSREYLESYRHALNHVEELKRKVSAARATLESITAQYDGEPTSGGDPLDRQRERQAMLADLSTDCENYSLYAEKKREEIRSFLQGVQNTEARLTLELYYCDLKSMESTEKKDGIPDILFCSRDKAYRDLRKGLSECDRLWRNRDRRY